MISERVAAAVKAQQVAATAILTDNAAQLPTRTLAFIAGRCAQTGDASVDGTACGMNSNPRPYG
jgi:hypothetical protein